MDIFRGFIGTSIVLTFVVIAYAKAKGINPTDLTFSDIKLMGDDILNTIVAALAYVSHLVSGIGTNSTPELPNIFNK